MIKVTYDVNTPCLFRMILYTNTRRYFIVISFDTRIYKAVALVSYLSHLSVCTTVDFHAAGFVSGPVVFPRGVELLSTTRCTLFSNRFIRKERERERESLLSREGSNEHLIMVEMV